MLKYPLTFLLAIILTIMSPTAFASVSYTEAQSILNRLTRANGIRIIKIQVIDKNYINAFGAPGYVGVTKGLLKHSNRSVLIAVLSHELGHAKGIYSEVGSDVASVGIARKAGLDVCPGARQFLSTIGKKGGGTHPDGLTRLKLMGCEK